jgi:uncharacterized protein (DUF1015 family)
MAEIHPFRALHYNPALLPDLGSVVTQPYDKITPEMQTRYYALSPYNLVRIIRGRQRPEDNPQDNVYVRAARDFRAWTQNGTLISAPQPALFVYDQQYDVPGQPGTRKQRRGFIALCQLEDYAARVIHRHEETLSRPKADRLELLKATRAHFGQLFMLYSDPTGSIEATLATHAQAKPWEQVTDEYGVTHSVWRVTDPGTIEPVVMAMRDKKLVIADGHHRYETALAYRDYCRAQGQRDPRAEYVMATFIRMETDGLTILPTHRLVHSLPRFDWLQSAAEARTAFDWEDVRMQGLVQEWNSRFLQVLGRAGHDRPTLGAYAGPGKLALLRLRQDFDIDRMLDKLPVTLRRLDVVLLHRLVLERLLGIDPEAVRAETNLSYYREFDVAAAQVEKGKAQVCFVLNSTPVNAVRDNALAGQVLPQKSTDFYPKLLSGLTICWLDNPAGL